jgi:hypothetical protein
MENSASLMSAFGGYSHHLSVSMARTGNTRGDCRKFAFPASQFDGEVDRH